MKAELIDSMGDDLRVVNAARVSFNKEVDWEYEDGDHFRLEKLSDKDKKLIKYLATHGHWTPFSHPQVTMRETVPIFVARQRFKHMVGFTYNEVSRRYVDDPPEFFTPSEWRGKPVNAKQGSSDTEIKFLEDEVWDQDYSLEPTVYKVFTPIDDVYRELLGHCEDVYNRMIANGVAPEQARMVLPQSMYTSYYVTGSLAAWSRAFNQRIDKHSQIEIQDLANQWDTIIRPLFPVSWGALVD